MAEMEPLEEMGEEAAPGAAAATPTDATGRLKKNSTQKKQLEEFFQGAPYPPHRLHDMAHPERNACVHPDFGFLGP